MPVETSVLVGIVCLVVGAAVAVLVMRNAKNGYPANVPRRGFPRRRFLAL